MDPVTSGMDPTLPLEAFANTTSPTGGDSLAYNLNVFYNVSTHTTKS
jgi:Amt family ammonium transporter